MRRSPPYADATMMKIGLAALGRRVDACKALIPILKCDNRAPEAIGWESAQSKHSGLEQETRPPVLCPPSIRELPSMLDKADYCSERARHLLSDATVLTYASGPGDRSQAKLRSFDQHGPFGVENLAVYATPPASPAAYSVSASYLWTSARNLCKAS